MARPRKLQWVLIVAPIRPMGASTHMDLNRTEVQGPAPEDVIRPALQAIMDTPEYKADRVRAWMSPVLQLDYAADTVGRLT